MRGLVDQIIWHRMTYKTSNDNHQNHLVSLSRDEQFGVMAQGYIKALQICCRVYSYFVLGWFRNFHFFNKFSLSLLTVARRIHDTAN